jgi:hypothetical protein
MRVRRMRSRGSMVSGGKGCRSITGRVRTVRRVERDEVEVEAVDDRC